MSKFNFKPFPVLTSSRLILHQIASYDNGAMYGYRCDPEVNRYLKRSPPKSIKEMDDFILARRLEIAQNINITWTIRLKEEDTMIGSICIWNMSNDKRSADVGYELNSAYHQQGYMG